MRSWLALTLSVAALAVSASSFYYRNLRVVDDLQVAIETEDWYFSSDRDAKAFGESVSLVLIVSNLGNRPGVLQDIGAAIRSTRLTGSYAYGAPIRLSDGVLPMTLQPQETRLLRAEVPLTSLTRYLSSADSASTVSQRPDARALQVGLTFLANDSRGRRLRTISDAVITADFDRKSILGFSAVGGSRVIHLFDPKAVRSFCPGFCIEGNLGGATDSMDSR